MSPEERTARRQGATNGRPAASVVVGVDGSDASSRALAWAAEEARMRSATLKVIRAWHVPTFAYGGDFDVPVFDDFDKIGTEVSASLDHQIASVLGEAPEVPVVRVVREGRAAEVVIEATRDEDVELVVVGTRGRGGFTGLLLGSVSGQVIQHARCPVTVVPPLDRRGRS